MIEKYYFYILQCSDDTHYYGHTNNLEGRLIYHNRGYVRSTKSKRPLKLVYFEECNTRSQAFGREMKFKNGKTRRETIDNLIKSFSKAKCQGFNSRISFMEYKVLHK